ncbi:sterol transporter periplasmic substrate-binding protein BstB [Methylomonas sp. MgM2]
MHKTYLIILIGLLASFVTHAATATESIVVCYPGGAGNIKDANDAMNSMLRIVERVGHWQESTLTSLFTTKTDECRKLIAEKTPRFAITSLGLYLELRSQRNLVPIAQPKINGQTSERYRIMVQKGKYKNLDELKGKTLGGTPLAEPAFIGKIVLAGKYDPADFFVLKTSNQAIRALRSLDKGELDAVILNEQQFSGLGSLRLSSPLEVIFTSEEIPLMGVVADSTATTDAERERFGNALQALCTDSEGKKLCELFGIDSFSETDSATFEPMVKLWAVDG